MKILIKQVILIIGVLCALPSRGFIKHYELKPLNKESKIKVDDFDFLDAYQLAVGETSLFGSYDKFIANIGLPSKITIRKVEYPINNKADLDKVISTAKNPDIVILNFQGLDMWYVYDNNIIPSTIDFRKTDKSIRYGETTFDRKYTIEQFRKQFPTSANFKTEVPNSFFEVVTNEKGKDYKSFILKRKSKDDPNAEPLIEFTFEKGQLIYIFFANF